MATAKRRRREPASVEERPDDIVVEDGRSVQWTSMSPDPPNFPMLVVDSFVPVRFFPFGQEDNVLYDVCELRDLLLNSDINQKSAFFDDKKFWPDLHPRSRLEVCQECRPASSAQQPPPLHGDPPTNPGIGPTREVFQAWEVAPLWRGMNAGLCAWVRDANEDFVRDCWKAHRSTQRALYEEQGQQIFSSADTTNEELELLTKYKLKYSRRDDTLLLALASIMCRSYRSVARLWKRIRCVPSNESAETVSDVDDRRSPQHRLEDCIVELEEMLISRHLKADPLDGGLQAHFDAFVEQAGQLNPLDPVEIARLTMAVQRTAEKEVTYLKRRCRYLLDRRITSEEALQPLEIAPVGVPISERPPRYIPIHRNIFTESAPEPDADALYGCHCEDGVCSPLTCECVIEGGRTYSPDGSLSVNGVGHVVECNHKCLCNPDTCRNRIIQNAVLTVRSRFPLQIVKTAKCGFGVVSVLPIPAGQFLCEYFGQIISEAEAQRLQREVYFPLGLNYIWTDSFELPNGESAFSIDSTTHGNISRFVNHSCDPNLFSCRIERQYRDPRVPQVCFFTKRSIRAGEELTLDYNFDASKKEIECQCGKKKCRKWLR